MNKEVYFENNPKEKYMVYHESFNFEKGCKKIKLTNCKFQNCTKCDDHIIFPKNKWDILLKVMMKNNFKIYLEDELNEKIKIFDSKYCKSFPAIYLYKMNDTFESLIITSKVDIERIDFKVAHCRIKERLPIYEEKYNILWNSGCTEFIFQLPKSYIKNKYYERVETPQSKKEEKEKNIMKKFGELIKNTSVSEDLAQPFLQDYERI